MSINDMKPNGSISTTDNASSSISDLPVPETEARLHSERLCQLIRDEIDKYSGRISFARYMELALYAPGLGYYSGALHKLGEAGDFVTAPVISPLFSRCVARQCQQVLNMMNKGEILEVGAGSGVMASDILTELETMNALPERYYILDVSADLRQRQTSTLQQRVPHLLERVSWLDRLPEDKFNGVILANEVLDAMPVQRVSIRDDGISEYYIAIEDDKFIWCLGPVTDKNLLARVNIIKELLDDLHGDGQFNTEVNLAAEYWIHSVADCIEKGLILVIDYGFPRHEFYHPERSEGTLMCHYQHRAHTDPLKLTGLQDITCHIDFTSIAEAALDSGLTVAGYSSQANFLIACGLTDIATAATGITQFQQAQQIKTLTLPSEMGELFKVLAMTRNIDEPLLGFSVKDDRGRL